MSGAEHVIVIGGGLDGLTAACKLARSGRRVTVVERSQQLGGRAAPLELESGQSVPAILQQHAHLPFKLVSDLGLDRFGLEFAETDTERWHVDENRAVCLSPEDDSPATPDDSSAHTSRRRFLARVRPALARLWSEPPPEAARPAGISQAFELLRSGVSLRRLGNDDLLELLRVAPMAIADWAREAYSDPLVVAGWCAPALSGTWLGPWSAGTTALAMLQEVTRTRPIKGGPCALASALESAARAAGVELVPGAEVESIVVEAGRTRGVRVRTGDGAGTDALDGQVLSTLDPRTTLLELCPRGLVAPEATRRLRAWRTRGTTAVMHLGLDAPLEVGPERSRLDHFTTGASVDDLERAFDAVKYDRQSEQPWLEVFAHEDGDHQAVSLLVHYAPSHLEGGWCEAATSSLESRALAALEAVSPGARERVRSARTITPAELEQSFGLPGGHVHHGELCLDQLFSARPSLALSRYATHIEGLWLGGAAGHPGGWMAGVTGWLAASRMG